METSTIHKLQEFIKEQIAYANKDGGTKFSTCNHRGWDKDIWNHKHAIMDNIRAQGFTVTYETNHGVLDVSIVKPITL